MNIEPKIKMMRLDDLKPYKNNPRRNDDAVDPVANSIREFGFKVPIVIDKNNEIVAGHTRYKAAQLLDIQEVPCIVADDLNEEQVRAYRLADNKTAEMADWDFDMLDIELSNVEDIDMSSFGFDFSDFDDALDKVVEDDFDDKPPEEPESKYGQIYKLGRHRLMCGDSTNLEDVQKLIGGGSADLLLTDPPYNVDYTGKTKDSLKIKNDQMQDDKFLSFLVDAFKNANEIMKEGAVFYIWHADSEGYNFRAACKKVGWNIRQCLIWNKNSMVMGRQDYQWKHEPCLYGWKEGAGHLWASDRKQTTVLEFQRPSKSELHPTMKPVALFDYCIKNNTKGGDVVLDLFCGSGTTIMACEQNGRIANCMEYDPRYVDVIIKRWEDFTGKKAELLNDN
ncbi:MAG: DNA modification methylase [Anaerovoracaceae bacterium]